MKRCCLFAVILITSVVAYAQDLTEKEAIKIASLFFQRNYEEFTAIEDAVPLYSGDTLCMYHVNFIDGKWCIVSSSRNASPILAYGMSSIDCSDTNSPHALLIDFYKETIKRRMAESSEELVDKAAWNHFLNDSISSKLFNFEGNPILYSRGGEKNSWGQSVNYNNTCSPSYNQECPIGNSCSCGHKYVGCGAVAIGQVLWYWSWSKRTSPYWNTRWDLLPGKLLENTPSDQVTALTRFLRDCGTAVNMNYILDTGSWCTMNNIEDALIDTFGYECSRKYDMDDWDYGDSWVHLIKSEIDNGRPVIYYGDKRDFRSGHYFVVDGYKLDNYYYFHVNFGNGGDYDSSYYLLDNFHSENHYYNKNLKAIVGISPTMENGIFELPYTTANFNHEEYAAHTIVIPDEGDGLDVEAGVQYHCEAGDSIVLKPGFHARRGTEALFSVNNNITSRMAISVNAWPNAYNPSSGIPFSINATNADSWEFVVKDRYSRVVFQDAGSIEDGVAKLWDGAGASPLQVYVCYIRLKNSYGRFLENEFSVVVFNSSPNNLSEPGCDDDNYEQKSKKSFVQNLDNFDTVSAKLSPNPSTGTVAIEVDEIPLSIHVYDIRGNQCYSDKYPNSTKFSIDLSTFRPGTYFVTLKLKNVLITKKMILL